MTDTPTPDEIDDRTDAAWESPEHPEATDQEVADLETYELVNDEDADTNGLRDHDENTEGAA